MGDEPVRLRLDTFAVQNWLSAHGHDVQTVRVLAQFGAGQSNPTYLLLCIGPSGQNKLVLRRKPPGELLPSAHKYMQNGAKTTMWLIIGMIIMATSLVLGA